VNPEYQGCGHVRLMVTPEFSDYYSVNLDGAAITDCTKASSVERCISSVDVATEVLSLFYK
jgi:hypothetical protein